MSRQTKITILGCGTSTGVPVISCNCAVCTSDDLKNKRTRSSLFLEHPSASILIDTGPDLRFQLLREKITHADAVLYTHAHADHTVGFDEIRAFCWRREDRLPIYASAETLEVMTRMFPWAFDVNYEGRGYVKAEGKLFPDTFSLGEIQVTPFPVVHSQMETHGFHFSLPSGKSFIYAPDVKSISEEHYPLLKSADLHIIDGLRLEPHPTHMSVKEACELADLLESPETYLTHLSHDINYAETPLPPQRHFAYDGLSLSL